MKLLVNTPQGRQELIEIGPGGAYFDESLVLWDERIDGNLPEITLGGMVREGDQLVFSEDRLAAEPAESVVIPTSVTMAQARKSLILFGITAGMVEEAIEGIADETQRALALTDWEYGTAVARDEPLVATVAEALGLTSEQLDQLFITASTL